MLLLNVRPAVTAVLLSVPGVFLGGLVLAAVGAADGLFYALGLAFVSVAVWRTLPLVLPDDVTLALWRTGRLLFRDQARRPTNPDVEAETAGTTWTALRSSGSSPWSPSTASDPATSLTTLATLAATLEAETEEPAEIEEYVARQVALARLAAAMAVKAAARAQMAPAKLQSSAPHE
jgi:hypothetical protein